MVVSTCEGAKGPKKKKKDTKGVSFGEYPNTKSPTNLSSTRQQAADYFGIIAPLTEPLWYCHAGDPNYTDSHRRLRETIRQYVDTEIEPFRADWEANEEVPPPVLKRYSDLSFTADNSQAIRLKFTNVGMQIMKATR
ncbi:hypothetical protein F5Y10DRAFT_259703 [Nemania abortiva]|nr:hypothetical protein F5Y10DRAFT_259703 [Nemania abortiva]